MGCVHKKDVNMPLSDKQLLSLHKKPQMKVIEVADRDSLSVRVSPKGKVVFQYRYRFRANGSKSYNC
jgi:hypothetical protein